MKTSKLTIATMFLASLAWSSVAKADDPCGAPAEVLKSCEVIEEPECYEVCEPDAMLVSCVADGSAKCMAQCADAKAIECEAGCAGSCQAQCADGLIPKQPQECVISCGSDCMGGCSAACLRSDDKTLCFAACGQQCSAHCSASCDGGGGYVPGLPEQPPLPGESELPKGGGEYVPDGCLVSCEQSCAGSCKAELARDCEIGCQAEAASSCKAELTERCERVCRGGGVLQCDEQFVDIDDVDACLAELEQQRVPVAGNIETLLPERGQATPSVSGCSVEDQAKLGLAGAVFTLLSFGLGAGLLRRRRR